MKRLIFVLLGFFLIAIGGITIDTSASLLAGSPAYENLIALGDEDPPVVKGALCSAGCMWTGESYDICGMCEDNPEEMCPEIHWWNISIGDWGRCPTID